MIVRPLQRVVGILILGLFAVITAACGGLSSEPQIVGALPTSAATAVQTISLPQTTPDLALGAQVYAENCTRCHGVSGKGDGELVQSGQVPAPIDFTSAAVPHEGAPIAWYEVVTNGRLDKLMPPWIDSLTENERWSVALYVYTLGHTPEQVAQGAALWAANCAECHGESGEGAPDNPQGVPLPNLLQVSDAEALAAVTDGLGDRMPSFADTLSPDERSAVVAFARTLGVGAAPVEIADASTTATDEAGATRTVVPPVATEETVPATAVAHATGTISGAITNGTAGGNVPADLAVTLHILADAQTTVGGGNTTLSGTANADGNYEFADVPVSAGWQYVVTATYQDAVFSSAVATGDPAAPEIDIPLTIYEVTDDPADIQMNGMLMMLQTDAQPGALDVVQIVSFSNTSDRAFVRQADGAPASVSVRLPAGAIYQDFSGGSYLTSPDGSEITDTQPVLPGDAHVMHLAFRVPYTGQASLEQPLSYPLDGQLEVMVGDNSTTITGDGITVLGTRQLGNSTYVSYGGAFNRAAGQSISYTINSAAAAQPTSTVPTNGLSTVALVLIGVGLLAIGAAFGFFMRERTSPAAAAAPAAPVTSGADAVIQQIAELDARYQSGKLSKTQYQKQRRALKQQAADLMKDEPPDDKGKH